MEDSSDIERKTTTDMDISNIINERDGDGNFELYPLPYTDDYLEPYIGERTVRFHYGKHLKTYIDNVNSLKKDYGNATMEQLVDLKEFNVALFQNASQVINHYLYFTQFNLKGTKIALSETLPIIEAQYGSWDVLKKYITEEALRVFGSGWVFLVIDKSGKLLVRSFIGTYTPLDETVLLALDVWEHAYYLDYQNNRAKYIDNFFEAIDWSVVDARMAKLNSCK